ncbi:MAG: phytanoyl-CoA dioxygenase family protein, partial [Candidatus Latescibacterota bacterium]|nr:phytanoyl-CoA dioxygenase family protein [Candidatus Latescibacterota bacterium]
HLRNVLSEEELKPAQQAADRYISMPPEQWPPEFGTDLDRRDLTGYAHGFAFDKSLEVLTQHPAIWPILMELTDYRPRLNGGTLGYNRHGHIFHRLHAGWRPSKRPDVRRYYVEDGKIRATDLVFFFYLTDVYPGDGGLIVLPGSHKAHFDRSPEMFYPGAVDNMDYVADTVPPGVHNPRFRAGDVFIMPEHLMHGALTWQPTDRDRRFLIVRYNVQHMVTGQRRPFPDAIRERLDPETIDLLELAPYYEYKDIVKEREGLE